MLPAPDCEIQLASGPIWLSEPAFVFPFPSTSTLERSYWKLTRVGVPMKYLSLSSCPLQGCLLLTTLVMNFSGTVLHHVRLQYMDMAPKKNRAGIIRSVYVPDHIVRGKNTLLTQLA